MVDVIQVCWQFASSQAVSKPVWDIPLLCAQCKTPDDGQRNCPKYVELYFKNKFEKLVRLLGFIIRFYHDARTPERQKNTNTNTNTPIQTHTHVHTNTHMHTKTNTQNTHTIYIHAYKHKHKSTCTNKHRHLYVYTHTHTHTHTQAHPRARQKFTLPSFSKTFSKYHPPPTNVKNTQRQIH